MDKNVWHKRIQRAEELSERKSSAHEVLSFYRHILDVQGRIYEGIAAQPPVNATATVDSALGKRLDPDVAMRWLPSVLLIARQYGPAKLAAEAERLESAGSAHQRQLVAGYQDGEEAADEAELLFARVVCQPIAEFLAAQSESSTAGSESKCPLCGSKPQLAVLRPEGDGGKRHLQCSFCLTEWEFRRVLCPACAEVDYARLPRFSPEEPNAVRVEACDTCKCYLKSFDMTADGLLVPEVDEVATIALDLWAAEQGYRKIKPNLMGF